MEQQVSIYLTNHNACQPVHYSNVSTTPLWQWGFWQCLPFSWTTLRGKHCRHLIAVMGVVDTFGHRRFLVGFCFSIVDRSNGMCLFLYVCLIRSYLDTFFMTLSRSSFCIINAHKLTNHLDLR